MNTFGLNEEKERCIPGKEWLRQTLKLEAYGNIAEDNIDGIARHYRCY